jgi:hypothetical protein
MYIRQENRHSFHTRQLSLYKYDIFKFVHRRGSDVHLKPRPVQSIRCRDYWLHERVMVVLFPAVARDITAHNAEKYLGSHIQQQSFTKVKRFTHLYLVARSRMSGVTICFHHTVSWCAPRELNLDLLIQFILIWQWHASFQTSLLSPHSWAGCELNQLRDNLLKTGRNNEWNHKIQNPVQALTWSRGLI